MNTPYGKDMYFFDIFIDNGRICMVLVADNLEKVQNAHIYVVFLKSIQKLLKIT